MRFGCCTNLNNLGLVESAGYDYIEPTVVETLIPEQNEVEFDKIRQKLNKANIKPEAFNVFLPGDLKVIGGNVDFQRLAHYVATVCRCAKLIGGEIIVFGSGAARTVPAGFSRDKAKLQLVDFLKMTGDYAAENGIQIALEPLHRGETNIVNSVLEAVGLVHAVNHSAIKVLADLFHITQENEPIENLVLAKDYLVHIHLAEPGQRLPPGTTQRYDYTPFFTDLHQIGYARRISIECKWVDFVYELTPALRYLKSVIHTDFFCKKA